MKEKKCPTAALPPSVPNAWGIHGTTISSCEEEKGKKTVWSSPQLPLEGKKKRNAEKNHPSPKLSRTILELLSLEGREFDSEYREGGSRRNSSPLLLHGEKKGGTSIVDDQF